MWSASTAGGRSVVQSCVPIGSPAARTQRGFLERGMSAHDALCLDRSPCFRRIVRRVMWNRHRIGGLMLDARAFLCARCERAVQICSRCDRGQRYCGALCSTLARRESMRAAGRRYQRSRRGRYCHAERQKRYRNRFRDRARRELVTHQGSLAPRCGVQLSRARGPMQCANPPEAPGHGARVRCHFCARPVSEALRTGWRRAAGSRIPDLPTRH